MIKIEITTEPNEQGSDPQFVLKSYSPDGKLVHMKKVGSLRWFMVDVHSSVLYAIETYADKL